MLSKTTVEELIATYAATVQIVTAVSIVADVLSVLPQHQWESVLSPALDGTAQDLLATAEQLLDWMNK